MMMVVMEMMIKMVIKINSHESLISVVDCKGATRCCCGQTLWCVPVPVSLFIILCLIVSLYIVAKDGKCDDDGRQPIWCVPVPVSLYIIVYHCIGCEN